MGSLFNFLGTPAGALLASVAMTLATWSYHKIKGDQAASYDDLMRGVGKQIVDALVKSGELTTDALTARARTLMASAMNALHVPDNAVTQALALSVVQHAVGDALAELRELDAATMDDANAKFAKVVDDAQKLPAEMAASEARGRELVKDMASMIEVVPPDPATPPTPPTLDPAAASPTKAAQP